MEKEIQEKSKEILTFSTKELFEKHPKLESFSWSQYTPYFNDGDECIFSVNNSYIEVKFDGKEFEEVSGSSFDKHNPSYGSTDYNKETRENVGLEEAYKDIEELLSSIDEDSYNNIFGDHVKVISSRKGFKTQDYEHD